MSARRRVAGSAGILHFTHRNEEFDKNIEKSIVKTRKMNSQGSPFQRKDENLNNTNKNIMGTLIKFQS